jgi:hypothetical protein
MGTGSFGGGGGGGGGAAVGAGTGGYRFEGGKVVGSGPSEGEIETTAGGVLVRLSKSNKKFLMAQFGSPMVREIYEKLFELSVHAFQNRSWDAIAERYGVPDGPGCLQRWVKAVVSIAAKDEPDGRIRATAQSCIESFLFDALNNNVTIYLKGTSAEVFAKMQNQVFERTSGYFLGHLIYQVLAREQEIIRQNAELQLRRVAFRRGDRVVAAFDKEFHVKHQVTYRQLFQVIAQNPDWFQKELLA